MGFLNFLKKQPFGFMYCAHLRAPLNIHGPMHRLAQISITNFRSCKDVTLPLDDFTAIVGYNNAGKSNILSAIEWLLDASALAATDFNELNHPVRVSGTISGISPALVAKMPPAQQKAITPYLVKEALQLRRTMEQPGAASTAKIEVRDPAIADDQEPGAWTPNPTGIQQALKALFPDSIRVRAMQNASDDVAKASKSNTIGKLIGEIIEPVRKDHEEELREALNKIANKLSVDGAERAEKLNEFDAGATENLKDLFPGIELKLDVPMPEIPELFKSGTVRVFESHGDSKTSRTFESVGHGAQRCIQMALIRYLAERKASAKDGKRTLLLIDEPELYLHPQGIEQVRQALKKLSTGSYQVLFSTHSPVMLHRDHAAHAITVRKPDSTRGTAARKPLASAVVDAIEDASHQSRVLFELGNAAQVFFSDRVLLNEGKTEQRLLPALYEKCIGRTPGADRTGFVPLNGSSNFPAAFRVLRAMEIEGKIVADLDFAFRGALIMCDGDSPDMAAVKAVLLRLSNAHGFPLDGGLPRTDKKVGWTAAKAWALFAKDGEGKKITEALHIKLRARGIWVWKEGTIEDVLGVSDKGEDAIESFEQGLASMDAELLRKQYPSMREFFGWVTE